MVRNEINDANLSHFKIDGAQMGGAYIKNIGMPPKGYLEYDPNTLLQQPVKFENCNVNSSKMTDCHLANVEIDDCNITGLKMDRSSIEKLI